MLGRRFEGGAASQSLPGGNAVPEGPSPFPRAGVPTPALPASSSDVDALAEVTRRRIGHRNVTTLGVTASILNAVVLSWSPVVPLLLRLHGASSGAVVATYAVWNLLAATLQFVGGRLADRVGARSVIIVPTVIAGSLWIAMGLLTKLGPWLGMALAFIAVEGVFGIQNTSFVTFVADSAPPDERANAFNRFQWPVAIGYVLGPLAGALLILPYVPAPVFITVTGLIYIGIYAIRQRILRPPPYEVLAPQEGTVFDALRPATLLRDLGRGSFGSAARRRLLVLTLGVSTLFALTVSGPFLALVGHSQDGLSQRTVELLFAVGPVGSVALGSASGPLIRRFGSMPVLAIAGCVLGASAVLMALPQRLVGLSLLFVVLFAAFQVASVAFGTVRAALAEGTESGISIGSSSAFAGAVAFLVLTVVSSLPAHRSSDVALGLAALVAIVTAIIALAPWGPAPEGPAARRPGGTHRDGSGSADVLS